jgi:hypothetical protein
MSGFRGCKVQRKFPFNAPSHRLVDRGASACPPRPRRPERLPTSILKRSWAIPPFVRRGACSIARWVWLRSLDLLCLDATVDSIEHG